MTYKYWNKLIWCSDTEREYITDILSCQDKFYPSSPFMITFTHDKQDKIRDNILLSYHLTQQTPDNNRIW